MLLRILVADESQPAAAARPRPQRSPPLRRTAHAEVTGMNGRMRMKWSEGGKEAKEGEGEGWRRGHIKALGPAIFAPSDTALHVSYPCAYKIKNLN